MHPRQFTHTCTIQRATPVKSTQGGVRDNYTAVATGVYCRAAPAGGRAGRNDFGEDIAYELDVYFPTGTDIRPADNGQVIDRISALTPLRTATATAAVYEVYSVRTFEDRRRAVLLAKCKAVPVSAVVNV